MDHTPLVNAIIDVMLNENEIRSTAYTTNMTADVDDRTVFFIFFLCFYFLKAEADEECSKIYGEDLHGIMYYISGSFFEF